MLFRSVGYRVGLRFRHLRLGLLADADATSRGCELAIPGDSLLVCSCIALVGTSHLWKGAWVVFTLRVHLNLHNGPGIGYRRGLVSRRYPSLFGWTQLPEQAARSRICVCPTIPRTMMTALSSLCMFVRRRTVQCNQSGANRPPRIEPDTQFPSQC